MKVGLVYDPIYLRHETGAHVESGKRLEETFDLLERTSLLKKLTLIKPRKASSEELQMVHDSSHISRVEAFSQRGGGWLDGDTVTSAESYKVALYAVGGVLQGIDALLKGVCPEANSIFCLVRPPGHHATKSRSMGFCLFNNIAIAARYAQGNYKIKRILIADFDVHHGNSTQEAFYDDPNVFYFSTHQYPFYPGTGAIDELGHGAGRRATVNVPLPAGCGDEGYLKVYEQILVPAARRFQPQLILVSAGFDPHWADQIAMMRLSVNGFAKITALLKSLAQELCEGKILFTLEGGYNLQALSYGIKSGLEILLEEKPGEEPLGPGPEGKAPPIDSILEAVKKVQQL